MNSGSRIRFTMLGAVVAHSSNAGLEVAFTIR